MKKLTKGKGLLGMVLTVLLLCALVVPATPVLANPDTSMSISPATQTVNAGESFDVEVVVATTGLTRAAQFDLSFAPSLVQVTSVTEGNYYSDWATAHGGLTYFNPGATNNTAGTVHMAAVAILGGGPGGQTGSGTFIVVHMTAKTGVSGTSALTLFDIIVADENAQAIPDVVINSGEVVVGAGEVTPPTVTTNAATGVTTNSATLNGNLTSLGTATSVNVSFEWGTTTSYGSETTPETMTSTGSFDAALSGLTPGATYHFRAKAVGDGTSYGSDRSFVTTGEAPSSVSVALTATILPAVSISVAPTSIDFGELAAGDVSSAHTITITNLGGKSVDVTAEATGDSLYVDGLWLDEGLWDVYSATIAKSAYTTTDATLHVPEDYTDLGTREGTLIFWAEVTP